MKKWIRHFANIRPKKGIVEVIEQIYEGENSRSKCSKLQSRIVKTIPITIEIPLKEYESTKEHFDSTAFQSSDREYSTTVKYLAPDKEICKKLKNEALVGLNVGPMERIE